MHIVVCWAQHLRYKAAFCSLFNKTGYSLHIGKAVAHCSLPLVIKGNHNIEKIFVCQVKAAVSLASLKPAPFTPKLKIDISLYTCKLLQSKVLP